MRKLFKRFIDFCFPMETVNVTFDEKWALDKAVSTAKNSNCKSQRGVIIWDRTFGFVSEGWNAPPKPFICDGTDKCRSNCAKTAVHAEQAALMKLPAYFIKHPMQSLHHLEMLHVKIVGDEAVISEKPSCWQCSKLILASGIKSMWLYEKSGFVEYTPELFHKLTLENCDLT